MVKESTCHAGNVGSISGLEGPLEEGMATTPLFLLRNPHGQRSLVDYSAWVAESQTALRDHTTTPKITDGSDEASSR